MNCNNCIHLNICRQYARYNNTLDEYCDGECENFKIKAKFKEVVHCKDCEYYDVVSFKDESMHYGYCENKHDDVSGARNRFEMDFCSYGKLRGEKE